MACSNFTQPFLTLNVYLRSYRVNPTSPKPSSRALILISSVISEVGSGIPVGSRFADFSAMSTIGLVALI